MSDWDCCLRLSSQGGFRLYPASIIPRLHFIANAKAVGFDLMAINELFQLQSTKAANLLN